MAVKHNSFGGSICNDFKISMEAIFRDQIYLEKERNLLKMKQIHIFAFLYFFN